MIFWGKIVIFYTKYPKNVRASLRSAQFFKCVPLFEILDPPLWRSVLFVEETGVPGENDRPVENH
jgi:hypothetical protein